VRNRDRLIGFREPVKPRYERVAFEKNLVSPVGQTPAAFLCPGHPMLNAVIDLTLERQRDLLRRGAVLVDERDPGTQPRILFFLEHAIQDASLTKSGERRVLNLDPHQVHQAEGQQKSADGAVKARLPEAYQWLLVPVQSSPQAQVQWEAYRLSGSDPLAIRASKKLRSEDLLAPSFAGTRLRMELDKIPLWRGDHVVTFDFTTWTKYAPALAALNPRLL
jgi:hypothetical protein